MARFSLWVVVLVACTCLGLVYGNGDGDDEVKQVGTPTSSDFLQLTVDDPWKTAYNNWVDFKKSYNTEWEVLKMKLATQRIDHDGYDVRKEQLYNWYTLNRCTLIKTNLQLLVDGNFLISKDTPVTILRNNVPQLIRTTVERLETDCKNLPNRAFEVTLVTGQTIRL